MAKSNRLKPPVSAWIVSERKRLGIKTDELARRVNAAGGHCTEGTVRTWEAGRKPSPDNIEALERVFGSRAPDQPPEGETALAAAIFAQNELLRQLVAETQASRAAQETIAQALGELAGLVAAGRRRGGRPGAPAQPVRGDSPR